MEPDEVEESPSNIKRNAPQNVKNSPINDRYGDTQAHNLKVGVAQSGSASASVAELDRASAFSAERTDNTKNIVLPEVVSVRRTMHPTKPNDVGDSVPHIDSSEDLTPTPTAKPKDVGASSTDITEVVVPKGYEPDFTDGVAILSDDIPWPPDYEQQGLLPPLAEGGIATLKLLDLPPDKVEETRARLAEYCAFVGYACRSSGCEFVASQATGLLPRYRCVSRHRLSY